MHENQDNKDTILENAIDVLQTEVPDLARQYIVAVVEDYRSAPVKRKLPRAQWHKRVMLVAGRAKALREALEDTGYFNQKLSSVLYQLEGKLDHKDEIRQYLLDLEAVHCKTANHLPHASGGRPRNEEDWKLVGACAFIFAATSSLSISTQEESAFVKFVNHVVNLAADRERDLRHVVRDWYNDTRPFIQKLPLYIGRPLSEFEKEVFRRIFKI